MVDFRVFEDHGQMEVWHGNANGQPFDLTFANGSLEVTIVDSIGKPRANQEDFIELKNEIVRAYNNR